MEQKLMYLVGETANFLESPYGYSEVYGIEKYHGAFCRDKAVFRVDLLYGLDKYISRETISTGRFAVYQIISGRSKDKSLISDAFKMLYKDDATFRRWLGESLYFDGVPESMSLYRYFIECTKKTVQDCVVFMWRSVSNYASNYLMHCGYMYVFIPDVDFVATIPKGFEWEVVSNAKAWRGNVKTE